MDSRKTATFLISVIVVMLLTAFFVNNSEDPPVAKEDWSARLYGPKTRDTITSFHVWLTENPTTSFDTVDVDELDNLHENIRNPRLPFAVTNAKTINCSEMSYRCRFSDGAVLECPVTARIYSDRTFLILSYPDAGADDEWADYADIVIDLERVLTKDSLDEFRKVFLQGREPSDWTETKL